MLFATALRLNCVHPHLGDGLGLLEALPRLSKCTLGNSHGSGRPVNLALQVGERNATECTSRKAAVASLRSTLRTCRASTCIGDEVAEQR